LRALLPGRAAFFLLLCFALLCFPQGAAVAQSSDVEKPVPILTGTAGTFSFVTAGQQTLDAQINPVLLVPLGDRWLGDGFSRLLESSTSACIPSGFAVCSRIL
jgi:hypothetical protein